MTGPDFSKIGRRCRRRGSTFERTFARWMTDATGFKWSRTANSGATDIAGDVYPVGRDCSRFVVECKHDVRYAFDRRISGSKTFEKAIEEMRSRYSTYSPFLPNPWVMLVVKDPVGIWVCPSLMRPLESQHTNLAGWFKCNYTMTTPSTVWGLVNGVTDEFGTDMARFCPEIPVRRI